MMQLVRSAALVFLVASPALGAGFARSDNFIVFTPSTQTKEAGQRFAEEVLKQAEAYRSQIAKEWFGEELPARSGRTVINVDLTSERDRGLTWAKDHPDRTLHSVFLATSAENALGCTLKHEIAHTVLATRHPHPHRLPPWLEEGIASRYDDEATLAARQRTVRAWGRFSRAPRLASLMEMDEMPSDDETSYAAAVSLVSFLLTRGDRQTLLVFGASAQSLGWEAALRTHYRMEGAGQLQAEWEAWLTTSDAQTERGPRPVRRGWNLGVPKVAASLPRI